MSKTVKDVVSEVIKEKEEDAKNYKRNTGFYIKDGNWVFWLNKFKDYKARNSKKTHTINYYGSKRTWQDEFKLLFEYAHNHYDCNSYIDTFAGSGILSLIAAKTYLYNYIQLNDIDYFIANYHKTMKDKLSFNHLCREIERISSMNEDYYFLFLKREMAKYKKSIGKWRIDRRKTNVDDAVFYYLYKHHLYDGQGGLVKKRKPAAKNINYLEATHKLYESITITQNHFEKVMKGHLGEANTLILLDCPYLPETREQIKSYNYELTERQHRYMLQELTTKKYIQAKVIVCGYDNKMYNNYFKRAKKKVNQDWHCIKLKRSGKKSQKAEAKEKIWINFDITNLVNQYPNLFELIY